VLGGLKFSYPPTQLGVWKVGGHHYKIPRLVFARGHTPCAYTDMNTTLDGKTLAECQDFHFKPVRTSRGENQYKYIVLNTVDGNRDTAIVVWLSKSLSEKYNDLEFANPWESVLRLQIDEETGEATHYLLTSKSLYVSHAELLAMFE